MQLGITVDVEIDGRTYLQGDLNLVHGGLIRILRVSWVDICHFVIGVVDVCPYRIYSETKSVCDRLVEEIGGTFCKVDPYVALKFRHTFLCEFGIGESDVCELVSGRHVFLVGSEA